METWKLILHYFCGQRRGRLHPRLFRPCRHRTDFRKSPLPLRLASRSLCRNRNSSITSLLALGLDCLLLLNLIPQFQYSLESEINLQDPESKLPQLFLFDIQEEHLSPPYPNTPISRTPHGKCYAVDPARLLAVKGVPLNRWTG